MVLLLLIEVEAEDGAMELRQQRCWKVQGPRGTAERGGTERIWPVGSRRTTAVRHDNEVRMAMADSMGLAGRRRWSPVERDMRERGNGRGRREEDGALNLMARGEVKGGRGILLVLLPIVGGDGSRGTRRSSGSG